MSKMRLCVMVAAASCLLAVAVRAEAEADPEARVKFKRPVPAVPKPNRLGGGKKKGIPSRPNINVNSLNSHRRQGRRGSEP